MTSYHSAYTPLRRAVSFSHYPNEHVECTFRSSALIDRGRVSDLPDPLVDQAMAGATPYVQPQEIYPLPAAGSYHGGLGLNGMGMASPYMSVYSPSTATGPEYESAHRDFMYSHYNATHSPRRYTRSPSLSSIETASTETYIGRGRDPAPKILHSSRAIPPGGYIEPGNLGSSLSGDFPSAPSNIVPLSLQDTGAFPPIPPSPPLPNNFIDDAPGTHQDRFASDSYDPYEDGYTHYGRSPYQRSRRMSSTSRYYPDYDDYSRYDRSPHHYSSRHYDRSPSYHSSSRYYDRDRYDRHYGYGRDYDRRRYDGHSSRYYSSGHRGANGESLMYRRTTNGDVQVLRNGRESVGDKFRRAVGLDPKGVNVVRLKHGESLVGSGRRY